MKNRVDINRLLKDLEMSTKGYRRTDCVPISGSLLYDVVTILKERKEENGKQDG